MDPTGQKLAAQAWMLTDETALVMAALTASGMPARFVGGCVRNALLNINVVDIDIATPLTPKQVVDHLTTAQIKNIPTGMDHGTITAIVNGTPFEITSLRKDVETDGRHATVAYTDDWMEDAARRDFTMNTLYMDLDGTLYDPFDGISDLNAGRVVFVGVAEERIQEDVLRILRFFRFFAHYGVGDPDPQGLKACQSLAHLIPNLSAERVRAEILKLLAADRAADVIKIMDQAGVLEKTLPGASNITALQALVDTERVYDGADPIRRLAALGNGAVLAAHLKLSNAHKKRLEAIERLSLPDEKEIKAFLYHHGPEALVDQLFLSGKGPDRIKDMYDLAQSWAAPAFPLSGTDVMKLGVPAGPKVGEALAKVESWWIAQNFTPDQAACIEHLKTCL